MPAGDGTDIGSAARRNGSITERGLLQSIVEVARSVFGAAAASVFLLDDRASELVFEAVSGAGEDTLVGRRFPRDSGLAGWVAMSGQPLIIDDVREDPKFARDIAESTGYVPSSIMAAPLIREGECVGVLEVLDRGSQERGALSDIELMGLLATEAALGLSLLTRLRWLATGQWQESDDTSPDDLALLRRLALWLPHAPPPVALAARRMLTAADDLLTSSGNGG